MSYIGRARYLELVQNSTQSITSSTVTAAQFPTSVKNTFGTNLTISGTGNTTFTNASGQDMFLMIHCSVAVDDSSSAQTALWLGIKPTRGIGSTTIPIMSANDTFFNDALPYSVCAPLFLANTDSFQIIVSTNGNQTLGTSTSIYGQTYKPILIVSQIPGI